MSKDPPDDSMNHDLATKFKSGMQRVGNMQNGYFNPGRDRRTSLERKYFIIVMKQFRIRWEHRRACMTICSQSEEFWDTGDKNALDIS